MTSIDAGSLIYALIYTLCFSAPCANKDFYFVATKSFKWVTTLRSTPHKTSELITAEKRDFLLRDLKFIPRCLLFDNFRKKKKGKLCDLLGVLTRGLYASNQHRCCEEGLKGFHLNLFNLFRVPYVALSGEICRRGEFMWDFGEKDFGRLWSSRVDCTDPFSYVKWNRVYKNHDFEYCLTKVWKFRIAFYFFYFFIWSDNFYTFSSLPQIRTVSRIQVFPISKIRLLLASFILSQRCMLRCMLSNCTLKFLILKICCTN